MSEKYTACIIGVGRIGFSLGFDRKREQPASHTMALLANPRIKLIAGCDVDRKKLTDWKTYVKRRSFFNFYASKNSPAIFLNVDELFLHCSPDIAVIAVNEEFHLDTALKVISKKPRLVILEKPVALNVSDAKKVLKQSKKYSVPVLINHERRFAVDYKLAYDYINKIGDVQKINASLFSGMKLYDPSEKKNRILQPSA